MTKHLLALLLLFSLEALGQPLKLSTYKVQEGETCEKIALKIYGDVKLSKMLRQHNGLSVAQPLKIGQRLLIIQVAPGATLTQLSGEVQVKPPQESAPRPAAKGEKIYLGWTIHTAPFASATLTLADGTQVKLGEETSLLFYGSDEVASMLRKDKVQAELLQGSLQMSRRAEMRLETPTTKLKLSDSTIQIQVSSDGTTWVSNKDGAEVLLFEKSTETRLELVAGMGSIVEPGRAPSEPHPLPESPEWSPETITTGLALTGDIGDITGVWSAATAATSYIVDLSREGEGIIQRSVITGESTSASFQALPLGVYWMTARSVDAMQFVSEPSPPRKFRVETPAIYLQDGTPTRPEDAVVGGYFRAPVGYQCTANEFESPKAGFTFTQPGALSISCQDDLGGMLPSIPVTVSRSALEVSTRELSRRTPTTLTFQVKGFQSLRLKSDIYAEFTPLSKIDADTWRTTVTIKDYAPDSLVIHLQSGPTEEPIQVGSAQLTIEPVATATLRPLAEESEPQETKPKVSVGLLTGISKNKAETFTDEALSPTFAGMRLGLGAENVAIEAEFTFSLPSEDQTASSLTGGLQASMMTSAKGPHALFFVGAGGDVTGNFDLRGFFSSGVGLGYESEQGVGVRLDLRGIYIAEGSPDNTFRQSSLGVFLRR